MTYKVCILAAGASRRVGDYADYVNKAVLPVHTKAVISYIIEKYPRDVEIVIAVGHRKESVIEYCTCAYPERKITIVEVEKYVGEGAGPGQSLLECKDHLECPFILATADTIVLEDIPPPTENWFGVAAIPDGQQERYCTVEIAHGAIAKISDKVANKNPDAFIGLAGVHDWERFFLALQENRKVISGEVQLSNGFQALVDAKIAAHRFTWFDTGTVEGFHAANRHFTPEGAFDFSKANEFIYFVNGRVIKFFADEMIAQRRIERAQILQGLCPAIACATTHFYAYEMLPGHVVYDELSVSVAERFFRWAQQALWSDVALNDADRQAFAHACTKFYKEKTLERIAQYAAKVGDEDRACTVNGSPAAPLSDLLATIDWQWICAGVPSGFHGDLQFDNVLLTPDGAFVLLDWRQDFGGLLAYGDRYYDLAKLYGGLIISYKSIKQNRFAFSEHGEAITYDVMETPALRESREAYERFLTKAGYDLGKVKTITALIFLNMAPLHQPPFDRMLMAMGREMLTTLLKGKPLLHAKKEADVAPYHGPTLCIGPMSKATVDTCIDYAHRTGVPINIIASRAQVETKALGGGYANNWCTEDFAAYIRARLKETPAPVKICRDHGGPWLHPNEKALAEPYAMLSAKASFEADIAAGFDMIHIDTSRMADGVFRMDEALRRAFELLLFCEEKAAQYGNRIGYEIGTEDADGGIVEPAEFEHFLRRIVEFCDAHKIPRPTYIVGRTGTLVKETAQHGTFDFENSVRIVAVARKYGVGIKEHNVDYDMPENLRLRKRAGISAINVAPEFGVLETREMLDYLKKIGRQDLYDQLIDLSYESKRWKKWVLEPDRTTREHKAVIAGHYVFGAQAFQDLKRELPPGHEEEIRKAIWDRLDWYVRHLRDT